MRTVPANIGHVVAVLDDLSDQHRAEHKALGLDRWEITKRARKFILSDRGYTGIHEGKPVFVFGVVKDGSENTTWFIATKQYFSLGWPAVAHAIRFMRRIRKQYGPLVSGSASPHPDLERWMKLLGYEKIDTYDGVTWFRFA